MCLRVLRDALVSQVEYFRLRRSRATASERAMVRARFGLTRRARYFAAVFSEKVVSPIFQICQYLYVVKSL